MNEKETPKQFGVLFFIKRWKKRPHFSFSFLAIPVLFRYNPPVKFIDFFEKNGYCQYEISNFARIDDEDVEVYKVKNFENLKKLQKNAGKHNLKYWRNMEFVGVGMSAAGYFDGERHSNVRTFRKYYASIDKDEFPVDENSIEIVDKEEKIKLERMLGLRLTQEGIEYFEDERVEKLLRDGLIEKVEFENGIDTRIRLTKKGMLLANNVFIEFV